MAVVGPNALGEAELTKEVTEPTQRGLEVEAEHPAALEQEAGVAILDRERKAELAVLGSELALEVGCPSGIGFWKDGQWRSRMGSTAAWLLGLDAAVPLQDPADRIDAGDRIDGGVLLKLRTDLLRSPAALLTDREDAIHDAWRRGVGAGVRPMRAILEARKSFLLIASDPLVACGTADVVPPAELGVREVGELGLDDEAGPFGVHG